MKLENHAIEDIAEQDYKYGFVTEIESDFVPKAATAGRDAIVAQFSDGHRTGIYTFKRLRELR